MSRIIRYNQGDMANPGRMMLPYIDLQLQIEYNLDDLHSLHHTIIQTYHKKVHQDDTGDAIGWIGQLNVVVDDLEYSTEYDEKSPEIRYPA